MAGVGMEDTISEIAGVKLVGPSSIERDRQGPSAGSGSHLLIDSTSKPGVSRLLIYCCRIAMGSDPREAGE